MLKANNSVAVIPSECFRWRPRVQFAESFRTRAAAINYAFEHGYNLIVERKEGNSQLFDVLQDPDGACTAGIDLELLNTEEVLVEPPPADWTRLMLVTLWNLAQWIATFATSFYIREIVPFSRRAASMARACLRDIGPVFRRMAVVTRSYLRQMAPIYQRATARARGCLRNLGPVYQQAAEVSGRCIREITLLVQSVACRLRWTNSAIAFRRMWRRHSYGSASDLARRLAASAGSAFTHQITPVYRKLTMTAEACLRQVVPAGRKAAAVAQASLRQS